MYLTLPTFSKLSWTLQLRNKTSNNLQYLLQGHYILFPYRKATIPKKILKLKEAVIKRFIRYKLFTVPSLECEISDWRKISQELNLSAVLLQRIRNFGLLAKSHIFASCCSYSCKATDNQQWLKLFYIYIEHRALFFLSVCI